MLKREYDILCYSSLPPKNIARKAWRWTHPSHDVFQVLEEMRGIGYIHTTNGWVEITNKGKLVKAVYEAIINDDEIIEDDEA